MFALSGLNGLTLAHAAKANIVPGADVDWSGKKVFLTMPSALEQHMRGIRLPTNPEIAAAMAAKGARITPFASQADYIIFENPRNLHVAPSFVKRVNVKNILQPAAPAASTTPRSRRGRPREASTTAALDAVMEERTLVP